MFCFNRWRKNVFVAFFGGLEVLNFQVGKVKMSFV
jgi:hypothetical protein